MTKQARIYSDEKTVSSLSGIGKWTTPSKEIKLVSCLTSYTKINSKWIKDPNVRPDTLKILEKNISKTLFDINYYNIIDLSPKSKEKSKNKQGPN